MTFISFEIAELIIIIITCVMLLIWIYRPHSIDKYKKYSKIPLKDEDNRGKK